VIEFAKFWGNLAKSLRLCAPAHEGAFLRNRVMIVGWPVLFPGIGYDARCLKRESSGPMSIVILGIDLGKNSCSCSVVRVGATGAVVVRRSMRRQTLID